MPSLVGTEVARTRSRVALAARRGTPDELAAAKRDHAAASIAAHIEKVTAAAPPLTEAQANRLAGLLRGGGGIA